MTPERRAEIVAMVEPYTRRREIVLYDVLSNCNVVAFSENGRVLPLERVPQNGSKWANGFIDAVVELLAETER